MKKYILIMGFVMNSGSQLCASTPEQLLPDGQDTITVNGVEGRKGSIKSLIDNVALLNVFLCEEGSQAQAIESITDLRDSIETQKAFKVFEVFPPRDWILGETAPGNIMVGVLYLQRYSEELTDELKEHLRRIAGNTHPLLKAEIEKLILGEENESK